MPARSPDFVLLDKGKGREGKGREGAAADKRKAKTLEIPHEIASTCWKCRWM